MRKLISLTFVFAMMLTLFVGLFGGIVEEGESVAVYNPGTETIYITDTGNTLLSIYLDIFNSSIFNLNLPNIYTTEANLFIATNSDLTINAGDILKFNGTLRMIVEGILYINGNEGNEATFTSNKTMPLQGDWEGITFNTTESSDSNLNYLILSFATIGIYCNGNSPTITNSLITQCSDNGIKCEDASPIIENNEISNNGDGGDNDAGLLLISSSPVIENTTFLSNPDRDIFLQSDSHPVSLNSSFDTGKIYFNDGLSNLTVKWYLHIYIYDNISGTPIEDASVLIRDINNNEIEGSPYTTNLDGYAHWIEVIEYVRSNAPPPIYHTPHNITVTHDEYYTGYAMPEPYIGSSILVQVNLTMIRRDLTTNAENITFTPSGVPVAGEDLTVYARIHNIEVDKAQDIRVIIIDDAPEGSQEIHNATISEILGNSYKNAVDVWQPTPGTHVIEVQIDPFNDVKEINSNPLIDAENNNEAFDTIDVNGRPIVDITSPLEDAEVNETITIEGTAYDDPADNGMAGNDIAQVDIRMEGYDWLEILPGPNLFYNPVFQIWEWQYEWDTTHWNVTTLPDGDYTLNARAWDNYHLSNLDEVNITINNSGADMPPNAVINEPISGSLFNVGDTITFNGSDSNDAHTAPEDLIYSWDFDDTVDTNGDGNKTNDEEAFGNITTHSYDYKGNFNITLTVIDEGGLNDTDTVSVDIFNYYPVPIINVSDMDPFENDTVTFNATESYDPDGFIDSYLWDFDDGSIPSPLPIVDHVFNESRIFNVTLTVTDNNVTTNITWIYINVGPNAQPTAVINDPGPGDAFSVNETIFFNASGSSDDNDEDLEYYWDFGDGNNSGWMSEPITWHDYKEKGPPLAYDYTVTLTVRDDELSEDTAQIDISVPNYMPVAESKANLTETLTINMITFWGNESYDDDGFIINYTWDFGDGVIYSEYYPDADGITSHSYEDDGVYTVNLTVTDNAQITYPGINPARDYTTFTITINNRDPSITEATADPQTTTTGKTIYFNVTASDMDGNITKYEWNFGQGYEDYTSTSGEATHSFNTKGNHSVLVKVTDDDGAQALRELFVDITNGPPNVNITSPTNGAEVYDVVIIEGTASDPDVGDTVTDVYVKIDDENDDWYIASGTDDWTFNWDTTDLLNGPHMIYAKSYDGENYSAVVSVSVTVDNAATDIEVTMDFNQTYVETGSSVRVYGDVIYDNGEPTENAMVNITIQNEGDYWTTKTGSDGSYSQNITAPENAGNYDIRATATKGGFSDVTQKRLYVSAPPAQPDLEILSSDIDFNPSAPDSGLTVTITITVRNIGDADANNVLVNAYNGDPDAGGTQIEPQGSETVTVSENSDEEVYLSWDTTGLSGLIYIYVELDRPDNIDETDEDNNKAYKLIDVTGKPDFAVDTEDISFSKSDPKVKEAIDIRIKIHNLGSESGEVEYEVYDGDPEGDGLLIESGIESITKDDFEMITVGWTPEESGDREIYVLLISDDDDNDENDQATKAITVEALPAEGGIPSWLLPLFGILVVVVVVLLLFLYMRGRGAKPEQELPVAQVVKKEEKSKAVEDEEEKEKTKGMMESHGGIRLG